MYIGLYIYRLLLSVDSQERWIKVLCSFFFRASRYIGTTETGAGRHV